MLLINISHSVNANAESWTALTLRPRIAADERSNGQGTIRSISQFCGATPFKWAKRKSVMPNVSEHLFFSACRMFHAALFFHHSSHDLFSPSSSCVVHHRATALLSPYVFSKISCLDFRNVHMTFLTFAVLLFSHLRSRLPQARWDLIFRSLSISIH